MKYKTHKLLLFARLFFAILLLPCIAFSQQTNFLSFKQWKLPQNALFFKIKQSQSWYDVPEEKREWLVPTVLSPEIFKALDIANVGIVMQRGAFENISNSANEKQMRVAAVREWKQAVRVEWLPPMSLITVGRMNPDTPRPSYEVAYSAFQRGDVRGLYLLSFNRELLLYIEQPASSNKSPAIQVKDVVRPDILKMSPKLRLSIQANEFLRYRAYLPSGSYERVRILLIRCELPTSLSISNFGYPGQVKQ